MQQPLDLCQELPVFFDQWCAYSRFTPLEDKLPAFFDELKEVLPAATVRLTPRPEPGEIELSCEHLSQVSGLLATTEKFQQLIEILFFNVKSLLLSDTLDSPKSSTISET